jgi:hypothetical protein
VLQLADEDPRNNLFTRSSAFGRAPLQPPSRRRSLAPHRDLRDTGAGFPMRF